MRNEVAAFNVKNNAPPSPARMRPNELKAKNSFTRVFKFVCKWLLFNDGFNYSKKKRKKKKQKNYFILKKKKKISKTKNFKNKLLHLNP